MYQNKHEIIRLLKEIQSVLGQHKCEYKNMNSDLCSFCYYISEIDWAVFELTKVDKK